MVRGGWHLDRRPGDHGLRVGEQSYRQPHDRFTGDHRRFGYHRPVRTRRPTMAQADAALGVSDTGPIRTAIGGGGILCKYTGAGGVSAVAIYAAQTATVFAGMVSHADDKVTGMQPVSGVGSGAFFLTAGGRSVVNAYSNGSRTVVAAQGPGAAAPIEALARVALSDN